MDELVLEAKSRIEKSIESLGNNFNTLRTGRANPSLLANIECEYYGDKIAINQISMISVPEPRQLLIKPYDKGDLKAICAAINASNIGINPTVDSDQIRLVMPALTEDTRKQLVKRAKAFAEECKVAIRNIRRDYMEMIHDDDVYTEDMQERVEKEFNKMLDEMNAKVDANLSAKEKEIMQI